MNEIVFDGVVKRYGAVTALDRLDLRLAPGSLTGLVGANGAGKSTALRVLLGLSRPDAGDARFGTRRYAQLVHPAREVGAMTDPDVFHPRRRGRDALRVLAAADGVSPRRVDEVLELVDLTEAAGRRVGGYSLGMRQRLALAAALLGDPPTLILDEPGNGLDPLGVRWLRGLIRRFAADGRTVLVSSHQLAELAQTVDDVAVVDHGRLVLHDSLAVVTARGVRSLEDLYLDTLDEEARP